MKGYELGELWITPDTYTITYSKKVPKVQRPVPSGKSTVAELVADVGRVHERPKNILAADLNATNITAGDDTSMVQFDLSESISRIITAKIRDADNSEYDRTCDDIKYKRRTGREVSHENEEERLARQKKLYGGPRLYKKLKRRWRNLRDAGKLKEAAEVRARMDKCVLTTKHSHKKRRKDSKSKAAAKASREHDQLICMIALLIGHWAAASNSLVILENLRGMYEGWSKQKGVFGRGLRRKLYSAAIMKMSDTIWDATRLLGVEAVKMNPYHTSKLCAVCRKPLSGGYHRRVCRHCECSVDRDVNSVENMRRTSAAAGMVRAGLGEARRDADIILDPASLAHGRWSGWADRLAAAGL